MRPPAIGEPFRVMYVKDCAFAQNACEAKELIDHCLGIAYSHKCNFLSFALDPSEPIISAIAEYKPIKVISHLYGRIFGDESLRTTQPIYVDPMDL
jgi:hypothetical protein